ncbi:hypothetical protein QBC38DRAFT_505097 [Podospora fimiseda]|uniref:Uncharacterized protein n=1 Tax=Podospora fimiseda TaxID=252190 RepID=A0AAN6YLA2_9PEZI|nr:hypothetical protein QBC38DRAFT_505097 [Podospora fimiseda]
MASVVGQLFRLEVWKALNVTLMVIVSVVVLSPRPSEKLFLLLCFIALVIVSSLVFCKSYEYFNKNARTEPVPTDTGDIYESPDLSYEAVHRYRTCGCPRRCFHGLNKDPLPPTSSPSSEPAEEPQDPPQDQSSSSSSGPSNDSGSELPESGRRSRFSFRPNDPSSISSDATDSSSGQGSKSRFGFRRPDSPAQSSTNTNQSSSSSNRISSISTGRPGEEGRQPVRPDEISSPTISSVSSGSARPGQVSPPSSISSHHSKSTAILDSRATRSSTGMYPAIMLDGATNSEASVRERYTIFNPRTDRARGTRTGYDDFLSDYDGYWDTFQPSRRERELDGNLLSPSWSPKDRDRLSDLLRPRR